MKDMYKPNGNYIDTVGIYDVCEWWIENYPDDIFINEPKEVVEIRKLMQKILEKKK
jgi:hypothetical protein